MQIRTKLKSFFTEGHERTLLAKKNIAYSFILKFGSILIGFVLVPLTIHYISTDQYGLWLTLSSIISWMSFFDVGFGNGLKNKLATANALKHHHNSRIFVSTTYAILTLIAVGLMIVFLIINNYLDWNRILNTSRTIGNLSQVALVVFCLFCVQFVAQILNTILTACHLIAKVSVILVIGQFFTLLAVLVLLNFTDSSLLLLVSINGGIPVFIMILASIWYYNNDLKDLSPSLKFVNFKYARELLSVGGSFFLIQIGALVLFQTDNIVIVQLFGSNSVTTFNIAYKLFSVFILGFNIIVAPLWSAFTDAYAIDDMLWIKATIKKMKFMWVMISVSTMVLCLAAPFIYKTWLNNSVVVPKSLSFAMAFYIIAYTWQTIHVYFLNGINKIRLQLYLVIISALVNIPLAIFLAKMFGLAGVTLANAIIFVFMGIIFSVQTSKILKNTASGIFNA